MKEPLREDFAEVRPLDEVGLRLLQAASIIREKGWCQHALRDAHGRHCAAGAIKAVSGGVCEGHYAAINRLRASVGVDVITWNDRPTTTAEMVIAALEAAAWSAP